LLPAIGVRLQYERAAELPKFSAGHLRIQRENKERLNTFLDEAQACTGARYRGPYEKCSLESYDAKLVRRGFVGCGVG
jgi:hypothetical protein